MAGKNVTLTTTKNVASGAPAEEEASPSTGAESRLKAMEEEAFNNKVRRVVSLLAEKSLPGVNNFYKGSAIRQSNLEKYFNALFWKQPDYMLIGEAPGIHGCALTGVPFTSERVVREGTTSRHFAAYRFVIQGNEYEATANYFWQMINCMPKPPVLWNVFPLHPYKMVDGQMKNRTPKESEKKWGQEVLQQVLELFPGVRIVTVGNHAKAACENLAIDTFCHLIHPAHHVNEFRAQFQAKIL